MPYYVHNHYSDAERAYEEAVDFLINALSKFESQSPRHEDDTPHFSRRRNRLRHSCRVA